MESDVLKEYNALINAHIDLSNAVAGLDKQDRITRFLKIKLEVVYGNIDSMADEISVITDQHPQRPGTGGD